MIDPKDREIDRLKLEIERLQQHIKQLQESVGSWRRKVQDKGPLRDCIREGFGNSKHYKVYAVQDIPRDLPIQQVVELLKEDFLPSVQPYQFERVDFSHRYDGWLVQVYQNMYVNMWNLQKK